MPFEISYATLAAAANEDDPDGDTLSFRIEAVSGGSLTKGGVPVTPGSTLLSPGEAIVWTPPLNANGTLDAFTVTAWDGSLASQPPVQVQVQVAAVNDPPTAAAGGPYSGQEGSSIAFAGSGSDVDSGDVLSYSWSFGDGTAPTEFGPSAAGAHTYADDGVYTATLTVRDLAGATATNDAQVTVSNVAPTVTAPADQAANEGASSSFALGAFADPGADSPWTVEVDWGDSTSPTTFDATSTGSLGSRNHTYADSGAYIVTVTVTDKDGGEGSGSFRVAVANVAPVVTPPADQAADEGASTAFNLGSFTDASADSPWTVQVDWGDGSALTTFDVTSTGSLPSQSHTYAARGTYTVTVRVTDKDGGEGSGTFQVAVANVAPALSGQFDQMAKEGVLTAFNLGSFADRGVDSPWTVQVDWGDSTGTTFSATVPGALGLQAHTYDDNGTYTVTVTVTDKEGAADSTTFHAVIRNVAPSVRIDSHVEAGPGGTHVGLWAKPSDPSNADTRAGFAYEWSLKRDGVEVGTGSANSLGFTIPAGDTAIYLAHLNVKDKDGGIGGTSWHTRGLLPSSGLGAVDARIQIVWPHGGAPVRSANLANISAYLLQPGTLRPAEPSGSPTVYLWRALNNAPGEVVATGTRRGSSALYDFNNIDVSAARDARNKLYFWVSVAGTPTRSNVWVHAQDGRTWAPRQDVPVGTGGIGTRVDARIEILWPHGNAAVRDAALANITAMLFRPDTLISAPVDWNPTVRLYRSLDNGVAEEVAVGVKRLVTQSGLTYPVWDFHNVDVSPARDPAHKLMFTLAVDGVETHSNVWLHGADGRTIFPAWDVVE